MKKNDLLEKKLKSYSALAVGMLAMSGMANGQIVYTDIEPDSTASDVGDLYELDLNNDGTIDFTITRGTGWGYDAITIAGEDTFNTALGNLSPWNYLYPYALSPGDTISGDKETWDDFGGTMALWYGPGMGNWVEGQTDKYLGLRIVVESDTLYGWARLDVNATEKSFTIKDYAYETAPGKGILAGDGKPAAIITDLVVADVADNNNGTDLQVDFNRPADESTVSEYRVMVVKSTNSGSFDLASAEAVTSDNYTVVNTATKGDVTITLNASATDVDGDAIAEGTAYKVFVLSVADGTNATVNALSASSDEITLDSSTGISELEINTKIYTNDGALIINTGNLELYNASVSVYDILGRHVITDKLNNIETRIYLDSSTSKIYIVSIDSDQGKLTKKVLMK